jgi:hypothetical protein
MADFEDAKVAYEMSKRRPATRNCCRGRRAALCARGSHGAGRAAVAPLRQARPPQLLPHHLGGRGRHRGQRLGRHAPAHVHLLLREDGLRDGGSGQGLRHRGRHRLGDAARQGRRTRSAISPASAARTDSPASARSTPRASARPASRPSKSPPSSRRPRSTIPEKDIEIIALRARERARRPERQQGRVRDPRRSQADGHQVVASTYRDQPQNKRRPDRAPGQARSRSRTSDASGNRGRERRRRSRLEQGWGTQIRSYVFYDNRVKDHRTGHEPYAFGWLW